MKKEGTLWLASFVTAIMVKYVSGTAGGKCNGLKTSVSSHINRKYQFHTPLHLPIKLMSMAVGSDRFRVCGEAAGASFQRRDPVLARTRGYCR